MPPDAQATIFVSGFYRAVELGEADLTDLQAFFERNPDYFVLVTGAVARPEEAHEAFFARPPANWPWSKKWTMAFLGADGEWLGMADVVADLLAPTVWHIGLFMIDSRHHGDGIARSLFAALEDWCARQGAKWLRLGVVSENRRAERFWLRCGWVTVRERAGIVMGAHINTVRVMVKPLAGGSLEDYLRRVPRDRADAD